MVYYKLKIILYTTCIALGMAADTGQVAKALCSMNVQPGPQGMPK